MTTPADLVQEACDLLAGYLPVMEREVPEQSAEGPAPGMHGRAADPPEPWNGPAGRALMDAWEGTRRLEAALRYALNGHPGARRGGSAGNTMAALDAIPRLAAGLPEDAGDAAVRVLNRWIGEAESLAAIDKARHWRTLPRPRTCPYCGCWFLKADMDARPVTIICFTVRCADGNGLRPVATMGTDGHGIPVLAWADGLTEVVAELDGLWAAGIAPRAARRSPGPGRTRPLTTPARWHARDAASRWNASRMAMTPRWLRRNARKDDAPTAAGSSPAAPSDPRKTPPTAGSSSSAPTTARNTAAPAVLSCACPGAATGVSSASAAETCGYGRRGTLGDPCGDPPLPRGRLRAILTMRPAR